MSGYDRFIAQGAAIKAKKAGQNGVVHKAPSTPVKSHSSSIEGLVIEKKEVKNDLLKGYKLPVPSKQNPVNINHLRVVDNRHYQDITGELVLPQEIISLVDNPAYLRRHRKLARDYGVKYLLKLAELARTKNIPNRWYAKVTSTANWQQTEEMLIGLFKKIDQVKEKLQGIGVPDGWLSYYVGAAAKLSEAKFNSCIELAKARGAKKPPNLLAKSIKLSLDAQKLATAKQ